MLIGGHAEIEIRPPGSDDLARRAGQSGREHEATSGFTAPRPPK